MENVIGKDVYEINLIHLGAKFWQKRNFIYKIICLFILIGVLIFFYNKVPRQYIASGVQELNVKGIPVNNIMSNNIVDSSLNMKVFSKIVYTTPFMRELLYSKVALEKQTDSVALGDYILNDRYRKQTLKTVLQKYILGLPSVVVGIFREKQLEPSYQLVVSAGDVMAEMKCFSFLKKQIILGSNSDARSLFTEVSTEDPYVSVQVLYLVQQLLNRYGVEYIMQSAQFNLEYITDKYEEAVRQISVKEQQISELKGSEKNTNTLTYQLREESLKNEWQLLYTNASKLAEQLIIAEVNLNKNQPVLMSRDSLNVIEVTKSGHGIVLYLIVFAFLGAFVGGNLVLMLPYLAKKSKWKRLSGWIPKENED